MEEQPACVETVVPWDGRSGVEYLVAVTRLKRLEQHPNACEEVFESPLVSTSKMEFYAVPEMYGSKLEKGFVISVEALHPLTEEGSLDSVVLHCAKNMPEDCVTDGYHGHLPEPQEQLKQFVFNYIGHLTPEGIMRICNEKKEDVSEYFECG